MQSYCGANGCSNIVSIQATAEATQADYARLAVNNVVQAVNRDPCAINACGMVAQACTACEVVNATANSDTSSAEPPKRALSTAIVAAVISATAAVLLLVAYLARARCRSAITRLTRRLYRVSDPVCTNVSWPALLVHSCSCLHSDCNTPRASLCSWNPACVECLHTAWPGISGIMFLHFLHRHQPRQHQPCQHQWYWQPH